MSRESHLATRKRWGRFPLRPRVGGLSRSFIYQPLAVLLAILLAPSFSWFESGFQSAGGAPFQASAQAQTGGGCGPFRVNATIQQNFCPGGSFYTRDLYQLESDAVTAYVAEHNLPSTDAHFIYDEGRTEFYTPLVRQVL